MTRPLMFQPTLSAFVFWLIYAVWIWLELSFASDRTRLGASTLASADEGENRDRGSRRVVVICQLIGFVAGFSAAFDLPAAAIHSHHTGVFWSGIVLMVIGIVFRQMAIRTLGRYFTFTVRVREAQPVVDFGPYKWIRHPSYTGAMLTITGIGLALTNGASLAILLLSSMVGYGYRISVEERALRETLGEPYAAYMRRTWRLIPFVF